MLGCTRKIIIFYSENVKLHFSNICPVSITQLIGQCIIICRDQGSKSGHLTYSPYKVNSNH